ncbi:MAG: hypothetical protein HC802_01510 [Caldilineaceae bacterium]|nr:hypothetical protein [Caldilineaceae bacterium]
MLRVRIVCTIGPASRELDVLSKLARAGMNVARLNLSHGTHDYHRGTIERVRTVSEELNKPICILADLQGPKLRVGKMQGDGVRITRDETLILTTDSIIGEPGRVPVQYKDLPKSLKAGERILIDDGLLEVEVLETTETEIITRVVIGGLLQNNKGMNLPDASLNIPALTEKDLEDVQFALHHQVDWIALSFVRTAQEVMDLKAIIHEHSAFGRATPVISKIEKPEAIHNIDDHHQRIGRHPWWRAAILGIETSPEVVPDDPENDHRQVPQGSQTGHHGHPDARLHDPQPTAHTRRSKRRGQCGVGWQRCHHALRRNRIRQLSRARVATMAKIAGEAERVFYESGLHIHYDSPSVFTASGAICHAAMQTATEVRARAIIAPTISGATAKLIAGFRPKVPVIAVTPSPMVQRQLCLYWGTYPLLTRRLSNTDEVVNDAINVAIRHEFIGEGDTVVLTAGVVGSVRSATNLMMVRTIERVLAHGTGLGQREVAGRLVRLRLPLNGNLPEIGPQDIIIADGIDRSCIKLLQRAGGLITREGGLNSHGAVAAVELGIPAVIGIADDMDRLDEGLKVILDATTGQVTEWKSHV